MADTQQPEEKISLPRMTILSDHPIYEDKDNPAVYGDGMHFKTKLAPIFDIIRHAQTQTPITIALYGDWGAGKTSAMRWLEHQLNRWNAYDRGERTPRNQPTLVHPTVQTVWFDPWKYTDREEVWRGLIAEVILKSIDVKGISIERVKYAVQQFGAFLGRSFLHAADHIALRVGTKESGVEVKGAMLKEIYDDYAKTAHPERAFLNAFEDTLKSWITQTLGEEERMVIFIDDLDRCLPEVTLEVLEAIKLYLGIPKLIFVVGLDRTVVDAVVRKHYKNNGISPDKSRHYLDKMFQVELQVAPTQQEVEEYQKTQIKALDQISNGRWEKALSGNHDIFEETIQRLCNNNLREVKRLLNSAIILGLTAEAEADEDQKDKCFAQGVQLYLLQRIIGFHYGRAYEAILGQKKAIEYLAQCAEFIQQYPKFDSTTRESSTANKDRDKIQPSPEEKAYQQLENNAPTFGPKEDAFKLQPLQIFLDLLKAIPFSKDLANSLAFAALPTPIPSTADTASAVFPAAIRNAIAASLKKAVDDLTEEDWLSVKELDLSCNDITDIQSLHHLKNLKILDLFHTQVSNIDTFKNMALLTVLNISSTQLNNIDALKNLTQLTKLYLWETQVSNIDALKNLTQLTKLYLWKTQVNNIDALKNLTLLTRLDISNTQVSNIDALKNMTLLTRLDISSTQVSDIDALENMTLLTRLNISSTQVSDINALKNMTLLIVLNISNTQINSIDALENMTLLRELNANSTQISDIGALENMTQLTCLDIRNTRVSDIRILYRIQSLTHVYIAGLNIPEYQLTPLRERGVRIEL